MPILPHIFLTTVHQGPSAYDQQGMEQTLYSAVMREQAMQASVKMASHHKP